MSPCAAGSASATQSPEAADVGRADPASREPAPADMICPGFPDDGEDRTARLALRRADRGLLGTGRPCSSTQTGVIEPQPPAERQNPADMRTAPRGLAHLSARGTGKALPVGDGSSGRSHSACSPWIADRRAHRRRSARQRGSRGQLDELRRTARSGMAGLPPERRGRALMPNSGRCVDAFLCAGLVDHSLPSSGRETIRPVALIQFRDGQIAD